MLALLQPYALALKIGLALALAVALGAAVIAYNSHERGIGRAEVQAAWSHADAVAVAARQGRVEAARNEERLLQSFANENQRKLHALRERTDADLAAALVSLRDRPLRPTAPGRGDVPAGAAGPAPAVGCTGAALFREDGEFLARYAAAAKSALDERDACYAQYGAAQRRLRAFSGSAGGTTPPPAGSGPP